MRLIRTIFPLFLFAAALWPAVVLAQDPTTPPATPPPATTPAPAPTPAPTPKPAATPAANNFWFTLSAGASQGNDSFGDFADVGSQFLGGVHVRLGDRITLGLSMGASNWSGVDIQSYHATQVTLDGRFHFLKSSNRMIPFVQVGGGSYQLVSEAEVEGVEPERASEDSWGVNYGGGVLFSIGKSAKLGPVMLYHAAGQIPEIGTLVGQGDVKFISLGVELVMPMGR